MEYGLIGEHLSHSFSKEIHGKIYDYKYELCEIEREKLDSFMREKSFRAINVTIPYKEAVLPYLDEIDPQAEKIGAVNTIINDGGKLKGYNTDFLGLLALITRHIKTLAGKKVLVLGSGGTSKTACAVAGKLGASEVYIVSRGERAGAITYAEAYKIHTDAKVIINTTPCGMYPNNGGKAIELDRFSEVEACFDAVYNPLRSAFILDAKERGIIAEGGLYMLVAQAVFAAEYFKSKKLPSGTIDKIFDEIYRKKQNLVLIGMPSVGKTTLGKRIAKKLGYSFLDTDEMIYAAEGKTPAEIINDLGEKVFREIEAREVKRAAAQQGAVIATGGGAVLLEENRRALRENGKIIFLNRPIEKLLTTGNRPLSNSEEKLRERYRERYPIYLAMADKKIDCGDSINENVLKIKEAFFNEN